MNLWGFISAAVLLTLMPGPDILFVITQSITRGRKAGMVFAAGLCTGLIAHVTAVSLGVSILLMSSPVAFTMLKFAGAAYLLYLGVKAFLARRENHFELSGDAAVSFQYIDFLFDLLDQFLYLFGIGDDDYGKFVNARDRRFRSRQAFDIDIPASEYRRDLA